MRNFDNFNSDLSSCFCLFLRVDDSVLRVALDLEVVARESEDDQSRPGRSKC